jgi:hypothetical protein
MGFQLKITRNQLGGCEMPWGIRGYGLRGVWVIRGLTVHVHCDLQLLDLHKVHVIPITNFSTVLMAIVSSVAHPNEYRLFSNFEIKYLKK